MKELIEYIARSLVDDPSQVQVIQDRSVGAVHLELRDQPVRLDRHVVHCRADGDSEHLDVQYLALAPDGAHERISEESTDLRWWPVDALPAGVDGSVRALVSRAVALVG